MRGCVKDNKKWEHGTVVYTGGSLFVRTVNVNTATGEVTGGFRINLNTLSVGTIQSSTRLSWTGSNSGIGSVGISQVTHEQALRAVAGGVIILVTCAVSAYAIVKTVGFGAPAIKPAAAAVISAIVAWIITGDFSVAPTQGLSENVCDLEV